MTQGRANSSQIGSTKTEPVARAVSPGVVSQIGIAQGNHLDDGRTGANPSANVYEGRGLSAPMASTTIHHGGSQGKHK